MSFTEPSVDKVSGVGTQTIGFNLRSTYHQLDFSQVSNCSWLLQVHYLIIIYPSSVRILPASLYCCYEFLSLDPCFSSMSFLCCHLNLFFSTFVLPCIPSLCFLYHILALPSHLTVFLLCPVILFLFLCSSP